MKTIEIDRNSGTLGRPRNVLSLRRYRRYVLLQRHYRKGRDAGRRLGPAGAQASGERAAGALAPVGRAL